MFDWQGISTYAVPFLLLGVPMLILVNWFLKQNLKMKQLELSLAVQKEMLPLKIQAYERLIILLERINPETIVLREQKQGLSNLQMHSILLKSIRKEFEHNLAMQIYLPAKSWELITQSRDEIIKLINTCSGEVKPDQPSIELSQKLMERSMNETNFRLNKAKETLRKDIELLYY